MKRSRPCSPHTTKTSSSTLLGTLLLSFCCCAACAGEQVIKQLDWPQPVEGVQKNARVVLHVWNDRDEPLTIPVLKLDNPPITSEQYALQGSIRYRDVQGDAFIEMWSHFPDGTAYFSRTLAEMGPMQKITGTSDWRPLLLPFMNNPGNPPPTTLVVNVVLPGKGEVDLSGMRLTQTASPPTTAPTTAPAGATSGQSPSSSAWWTPQTGGWFFGVLGTAAGLLGGLVGMLAQLRRARGAVVTIVYGMVAFGAMALVAGFVALVRSQPYAVYYPLLLLGGLSVIIPAACLPGINRQYRELELRRMQALDAA